VLGLYRTRPRTRFAALVLVKQTKVVFRGRVQYEDFSLFYLDHSSANAAKPRSRSV